MNENVKIHKQSDKYWIDEEKVSVPYKYISSVDKQKEIAASKIMKKAEKAHDYLVELKNYVKEISTDLWEESIKEIFESGSGKIPKGNFTWFNFDRSIKVQVSISDRIAFDDAEIAVCKFKLDEYLNDTIESKEPLAKDIVLNAFETSNGNLDPTKVLSLMKWKSKIKNHKFQEALDHLQKSIRRPSSTKYYRVWTKDEEGKHNMINLNFSSI